MMKLLSLLSVCLVAVRGADWTYTGDHGPEHWGDDNPSCILTSQSPIDVETSIATYRSDLSDFTFNGYDATNIGLTLTNNGHAAQVNVAGSEVSVTGGGLPEPYKLAQFHFHWGSTNGQGSEHTMNGNQYCMEMHLVHYAVSRTDLGGAAAMPQGLAVLGFFFEIGPHNTNFDQIINHLTDVQDKDDTYDVTGLRLDTLLPVSLDKYYRYSGSLTTPGCYQSVIWTLFEDTIMISSSQMEAFRALMHEGDAIEDNYRPIQALNSRSIFTNDADHATVSITDSASSVSAASAMFTVVSALVIRMLF